jgi:ATP-dependent helicase/nuclease subunit B
LRQLRLQAPPELDVETEKRDFGDWLHEVLKTFHEEHRVHAWTEPEWPGQLDRIADACSAQRKLGAAEFLPFSAAWPKLRDGYLRWWSEYQRQRRPDV